MFRLNNNNEWKILLINYMFKMWGDIISFLNDFKIMFKLLFFLKKFQCWFYIGLLQKSVYERNIYKFQNMIIEIY